MAEPKIKPRLFSVIALNQPEWHLVTWHHLKADFQPDLLTPALHFLFPITSPAPHLHRTSLPSEGTPPQQPPVNPFHPLPALSCLTHPLSLLHCCYRNYPALSGSGWGRAPGNCHLHLILASGTQKAGSPTRGNLASPPRSQDNIPKSHILGSCREGHLGEVMP